MTANDPNSWTVVVANGRVTLNARTPVRSIPAGGFVLVARGTAVRNYLWRMAKGGALTPRVGYAGNVAVAVGGSGLLVRDGAVVNRANAAVEPRSVVAFDRDLRRLYLFVVDGRSPRSRGITHFEAATIARWLGAEEALNLDGGGSSALLVRSSGVLRVANQPSDGRPRSIPNGIAVYSR